MNGHVDTLGQVVGRVVRGETVGRALWYAADVVDIDFDFDNMRNMAVVAVEEGNTSCCDGYCGGNWLTGLVVSRNHTH